MDNNNADDWEEQMLEDMAKMFSEMGMPIDIETVSYTHLTLPTICSV